MESTSCPGTGRGLAGLIARPGRSSSETIWCGKDASVGAFPRIRRALVHCNAPAQSWSADFKGDVPLANGKRCYPLTLTDNHSRFILQCRALSHPTTDAVKPWFEWVFREYGLPETLRTDNGPPFASVAAGGLSQLSKWWIRLGIRPRAHPPGQAQ